MLEVLKIAFHDSPRSIRGGRQWRRCCWEEGWLSKLLWGKYLLGVRSVMYHRSTRWVDPINSVDLSFFSSELLISPLLHLVESYEIFESFCVLLKLIVLYDTRVSLGHELCWSGLCFGCGCSTTWDCCPWSGWVHDSKGIEGEEDRKMVWINNISSSPTGSKGRIWGSHERQSKWRVLDNHISDHKFAGPRS